MTTIIQSPEKEKCKYIIVRSLYYTRSGITILYMKWQLNTLSLWSIEDVNMNPKVTPKVTKQSLNVNENLCVYYLYYFF